MIRTMHTEEREWQQRELHQKVDLARLRASQQEISDGRNPDEMRGLTVYVGPMSLAIDGGSKNARWAVTLQLRELGIVTDCTEAPQSAGN